MYLCCYYKMSLQNYLKILKNLKKISQQIYYQHNNASIVPVATTTAGTTTTQQATTSTQQSTSTTLTTTVDDKQQNRQYKKYPINSNQNSNTNINNNKITKDIINNNNTIIMGYNIDWIFPRLKHPSRFWHIACTITVAAVGFFSKLILIWLNKTRIYNKHILKDAVASRPKGIPLITVSNHHSCFDDPGIWGSLPLRYLCGKNSIRWSLAAHDICFTNKYHSLFFMFGKCIPVVRGAGVYQQAVDVCIQKVTQGDWVHVFPEGRVNVAKEIIRFKWGVGRIIYESPIIPIIIPIWHEGMDSVLPNDPPYVLRFGKKVTINIGKPIELNEFVENLRQQNIPEPEARKLITDKIQEEMTNLRKETQVLHARC